MDLTPFSAYQHKVIQAQPYTTFFNHYGNPLPALNALCRAVFLDQKNAARTFVLKLRLDPSDDAQLTRLVLVLLMTVFLETSGGALDNEDRQVMGQFLQCLCRKDQPGSVCVELLDRTMVRQWAHVTHTLFAVQQGYLGKHLKACDRNRILVTVYALYTTRLIYQIQRLKQAPNMPDFQDRVSVEDMATAQFLLVATHMLFNYDYTNFSLNAVLVHSSPECKQVGRAYWLLQNVLKELILLPDLRNVDILMERIGYQRMQSSFMGRVNVFFGRLKDVPEDAFQFRQRAYLGLQEIMVYLDTDYAPFYRHFILRHLEDGGSLQRLYTDFLHGKCVVPHIFLKGYRKVANAAYNALQTSAVGIDYVSCALAELVDFPFKLMALLFVHLPMACAKAAHAVMLWPWWTVDAMAGGMAYLRNRVLPHYADQMQRGWQMQLQPWQDMADTATNTPVYVFAGLMHAATYASLFMNTLLDVGLSVPVDIVTQATTFVGTTLKNYHVRYRRWRYGDIAKITAVVGAQPVLWKAAESPAMLVALYNPLAVEGERPRVLQIHAVPRAVTEGGPLVGQDAQVIMDAAVSKVAQALTDVSIYVEAQEEVVQEAMSRQVEPDRIPQAGGQGEPSLLEQVLSVETLMDPEFLQDSVLHLSTALATGYMVEELPTEMVVRLNLPSDPTKVESKGTYSGPTFSGFIPKVISQTDPKSRAMWARDAYDGLHLVLPQLKEVTSLAKRTHFAVVTPV